MAQQIIETWAKIPTEFNKLYFEQLGITPGSMLEVLLWEGVQHMSGFGIGSMLFYNKKEKPVWSGRKIVGAVRHIEEHIVLLENPIGVSKAPRFEPHHTCVSVVYNAIHRAVQLKESGAGRGIAQISEDSVFKVTLRKNVLPPEWGPNGLIFPAPQSQINEPGEVLVGYCKPAAQELLAMRGGIEPGILFACGALPASLIPASAIYSITQCTSAADTKS